MKTQLDYDIYRDNPTLVSKRSASTIDRLKESINSGLNDKLNIDKLFFIASKGAKSKRIVWDLIKKNKISVLRAHGRPNEYQHFKEMAEKLMQEEKKESFNH